MVMDYLLNPLICTILCAQLARNFAAGVAGVPYFIWAVLFAGLFTSLNLFGIRTSARINDTLAIGMGVVIAIFFVVAAHYMFGHPHSGTAFFTRPFYDPHAFQVKSVLGGTSLAVLTSIGFDGISTLSEETKNPKRDILLATVLVCLITGLRAGCEVYAAQLIWPASKPFPDVIGKRNAAGCYYRLWNGISTGCCAPLIRHGQEQRDSQIIFWCDRSGPAHSPE